MSAVALLSSTGGTQGGLASGVACAVSAHLGRSVPVCARNPFVPPPFALSIAVQSDILRLPTAIAETRMKMATDSDLNTDAIHGVTPGSTACQVESWQVNYESF